MITKTIGFINDSIMIHKLLQYTIIRQCLWNILLIENQKDSMAVRGSLTDLWLDKNRQMEIYIVHQFLIISMYQIHKFFVEDQYP